MQADDLKLIEALDAQLFRVQLAIMALTSGEPQRRNIARILGLDLAEADPAAVDLGPTLPFAE